jgi:NAD+ kinase
MATLAFIPHRTRSQAAELIATTAEWLEDLGHEVRVPTEDAEAVGLKRWMVDEDVLTQGLDLAVSLGGDGTMLRAVHLMCGAEVPVLGVNVGHLGYLTEVEPAGMRSAIERWLAGEQPVESRMTLEVVVAKSDGSQSSHMALNEAVLQRTGAGHTVRVGTTIDGVPFLTYVADGLIVSTPTGSTAYNLSARGPIVSPGHRAMVLTPVSPHMLFNLSLVLSGSEIVRFEVLDGRPADLVVDGQPISELDSGDTVTCFAGPKDARLVSLHRRDFHRIVKAKFGLDGG